MSGADIVAEGSDFTTFRILGIAPNSPAAEAGLLEAASITAIDGRPATEFTLDKINRMLRQAGSEYALTIKRGARLLDVKLRLRPSI